MKILILGAGKMGCFFTDILSFDHETAVYEIDPKRMRFLYNTLRFTKLEEIRDFRPDLVINCVTLQHTIEVFRQVIPYLHKDCIISDIASVKTDLKAFYEETGMHYVSTHPMFGPTFANLGALSSENAIVINEGDYLGRVFFLSVPFVSTFVFSAVMKHQDAPGTTFKRHLAIARGVLSEDETLLREILFNPRTKSHVEDIREELKGLIQIIDNHDAGALSKFLTRIRKNIK